jgi:DNA (cytosine-5)-methyltransferase 1
MALTAIDLFSGGGGASLGLHRVDNINLCGAAEINEDVRKYYNKNLPVEAANIDLTDETALTQLCEKYDLHKSDIDIVMGCPPCQKFSTLQYTTPEVDGPKNKLLNAYIDLIIEISPKIVLFENVPGLLDSKNKPFVEEIKEYLRKSGYKLDMQLLNTADYGVPQDRDRVIAIGIRGKGIKSDDVSLPNSTHAPPEEAARSDKKPYKTVADVIRGLPELEAGEKADEVPFNGHRARNHRQDTVDFMKKIPNDGGSRTDLPHEEQLDCHKRLDDKTSAGNVYGRMEWDKPGSTLTGRCITPSSGRFVHPEQNRGISPREAARIMTFPDDYDLPDKNSVAESLIGNAVPPDFVATVVSEFLDQHDYLINTQKTQTVDTQETDTHPAQPAD